MPNHISHFSIHADDCGRACKFYGDVFGWKFQAWGPPGFFLIDTGSGGIHGAVQQRREPLASQETAGKPMLGYECTVGVDDVEAIAKSIVQHGGKILMPPSEIPTVGTLIQFRDTEGNVACAMKYV
jgi:predicted enzyme related to lactoylglutathione lyase